MATISSEQSCGSAINVSAKVGIQLISCTRSGSSDSITVKIKAYLYQDTKTYSKNSWAIYVNSTRYIVHSNSQTGTNYTTQNTKYYTPEITLTLTCPNTSVSFAVYVDGNYWSPPESVTSDNKKFTFTLSGVPQKTFTVTFNANGGTIPAGSSWTGSGSTATKTVTQSSTYGTFPTPTRSNYNFTGWYTAASNGSRVQGTDTVNLTGAQTLYAHWSLSTSSCGAPTNLSIRDGGDNTIILQCTSGTSGVGNSTSSVEFFVTLNNSNPSTSNYQYKLIESVSASTPITKVIDFSKVSEQFIATLLKENDADIVNYIGTVKFTARTLGSAGESFCSDAAAAVSCSFTWHGSITPAKILKPDITGDIIGTYDSAYIVTWEQAIGGINNSIFDELLVLYDITSGNTEYVTSYNVASSDHQIVDISVFNVDHVYKFALYSVGQMYMNTGGWWPVDYSDVINSPYATVAWSGPLTIKYIEPSPLVVEASDGGTVPSVTLDNIKTYMDIGSGEVLKLTWNRPTGINNEFTTTYVQLCYMDSSGSTSSLSHLLTRNVGDITKFVIDSDMLSTVPLDNYILVANLRAESKYGPDYSAVSDTLSINVKKACGVYIKVSEDYSEPIMKRAVALARISENAYGLLQDNQFITLADSTGALLACKRSVWTVMQKFYKKDNKNWKLNDISYEVLVDSNGEIITDINNEAIYIK